MVVSGLWLISTSLLLLVRAFFNVSRAMGWATECQVFSLTKEGRMQITPVWWVVSGGTSVSVCEE